MSDGTGVINLRSLGNQGLGGQDPAFEVLGDDGWYYRYNPCYPWNSYQYTGLAVIYYTTLKNFFLSY